MTPEEFKWQAQVPALFGCVPVFRGALSHTHRDLMMAMMTMVMVMVMVMVSDACAKKCCFRTSISPFAHWHS